MKFRIFSVTLALCLLLGGLFASCGNNSTISGNDTDTVMDTSIETEKEAVSETEAETLEAMPPESIFDEDLRTPIENEKALSFIEFQYAKALEAIGFAKGGLSYDINTEMIREDGRICYPVNDSTAREELEGEAIVSLENLSEYLRSIFVRSIADDLIDTAGELYADVDGVLCFISDRMADGFEIETEEIEETEETEEMPMESESQNEEEPSAPVVASTEFFLSGFSEKQFRYTAKVSFEGIEEAEYFDFIFENTGNGWYFTSFPALPE